MWKIFLIASTLALSSCGAGGGGAAGSVEAACNQSDRSRANPRVCRCIAQVAGETLTRSEQRRAAQFFVQPDLAQTARAKGGEFWRRYRNYSDTAAAKCG